MCTIEDHDLLRSDPQQMREQTVLIGVQPDENGEMLVELRNCKCGSTLALLVEPPCST